MLDAKIFESQINQKWLGARKPKTLNRKLTSTEVTHEGREP